MDGASQRQSETMKHRFACACALSLVACGGSALDVGSNSGGSSGSTAEGGSDSGGSGNALGGDGNAAGNASGAQASGGLFGKGGNTTGTGGEVSMGARAATGGTPSTGTAAAGGDAMGARAATGGKSSNGTAGSGAQMPMGGASSTDGPPNALVPQMCSQELNQVWEGSTLDFFFNPLDDRWRIELTGTDANGRVCGTATYLAAGQPAPPPATDPDAAYPPGYDPFNAAIGMKGLVTVWPGVTYSIIQGAEVAGVLRFRLSPSELWKDWCALQTPVRQGDHYGCVGGDGGWGSDGVTCTVSNSDGSTQSYPAAKCNLCAGIPVCTCDATHCVASDQGTSVVFDLKRVDATLTGTVDSAMVTLNLVE
jgi:hypothetical protein